MQGFLDHGFPMEWQSDMLLGFQIQGLTEETKQPHPKMKAFLADLMDADLKISDTANIPGVWSQEDLGILYILLFLFLIQTKK